MMVDYMKNMLIGLFVAVACILVVGMILFLEPSVGDGGQTLIMRFSNITGLSVGTRVMFAGKPVGEVARIEQIPDARKQPTDELGQIYMYQLVLHIDSSVKAYNTDDFTVVTAGLLGEKSVAIIPKVPPKGITPKLITAKTPVYAESVDPIQSVFNVVTSVADKVEEGLDKIIGWVDQNGTELGSAIQSFDDAMSEASIAMQRINKLHLVDDVGLAVQNFSDAMQQVNDAMHTLTADNTFENIGSTMQQMKEASFDINAITRTVREGKSTLGQLLVQDGAYLQLNAIMTKVNTLMNDLNHYGLFYNLNKQWQRARLSQVRKLEALDTPQDFKAYYEKEIDHINMAMSRLSLLIDKAQQTPKQEEILDSTQFKDHFSELLQNTEALIQTLKLYNAQLIHAAGD